MDLTLQVAGVIAPELRHGALFSQGRLDRFKALAAIAIGMTRPLLAVALLMKNDPTMERRFRAAFPHRPNWPEAAYLGVIWNKSRTNNVIDG